MLKNDEGPTDGSSFVCKDCGTEITESHPNAEAYSHTVLSYLFICPNLECDTEWWVSSNQYHTAIKLFLGI